MTQIIHIYLEFWIITIPISCYVLFLLTIEILDIVLNSSQINTLLKKSDRLNVDYLFHEYETQKKKQKELEKSTLLEMERQIKYSRDRWATEASRRAKELSDTFKIK